jgi:hypothetical protein
VKFRDAQSFIALGPIAKVNKKSRFKPVVYADFDAILKSAVEIRSRLEGIERAYRRSVSLGSEPDFRTALPKHRVLFLADLIHLLSPTTLAELVEVLRYLFGPVFYDIKLELGLLRSLGLVKQLDKGFLGYSTGEPAFFFDYQGESSSALRGLVVRYYVQKSRDRLLDFCPRL